MTDTTGDGGVVSGFWAELKRRRVIRVLVIYAIVGWVVIEVSSTVLPGLNLPEWTTTLVIVLVGLGLPFALAMAWLFDIGPGGVHRTEPVEPEAAARSKQPVAPVAAAPRPRHREADNRRSIAVLPFVNMSGEEENEYFSDGVAEEILNLLTRLPQLRVASRSSAFAYKGEHVNVKKVAQDLEVSTLLEGSVRRHGDRVRITAQLIDTATDSHLWSETYDRELQDVFAIQDDIAQSIVKALEVTLSPRDRRALQYVATTNPEAYDYYLRGRKYFYAMSSRDFQHALKMYERAIALDPTYAIAHAGMADTYSQIFRYADATPENASKALESSERAVELDYDSAEAHASRGLALFINERYDEAERHFETAILLNRNLFEGYYFYAVSCFSQGNYEKAARLFVQASEVNPSEYQVQGFLSLCYTSIGRNEEADAARRRNVELVERHLDLNPDDTRALYLGAVNLASLGERERALEWAERAYESAPEEPMVLYNVACTCAVLGETERALDLLDKAIQLGWGDRAWLESDSDLDNLREEPRFKALLETID